MDSTLYANLVNPDSPLHWKKFGACFVYPPPGGYCGHTTGTSGAKLNELNDRASESDWKGKNVCPGTRPTPLCWASREGLELRGWHWPGQKKEILSRKLLFPKDHQEFVWRTAPIGADPSDEFNPTEGMSTREVKKVAQKALLKRLWDATEETEIPDLATGVEPSASPAQGSDDESGSTDPDRANLPPWLQNRGPPPSMAESTATSQATKGRKGKRRHTASRAGRDDRLGTVHFKFRCFDAYYDRQLGIACYDSYREYHKLAPTTSATRKDAAWYIRAYMPVRDEILTFAFLKSMQEGMEATAFPEDFSRFETKRREDRLKQLDQQPKPKAKAARKSVHWGEIVVDEEDEGPVQAPPIRHVFCLPGQVRGPYSNPDTMATKLQRAFHKAPPEAMIGVQYLRSSVGNQLVFRR